MEVQLWTQILVQSQLGYFLSCPGASVSSQEHGVTIVTISGRWLF